MSLSRLFSLILLVFSISCHGMIPKRAQKRAAILAAQIAPHACSATAAYLQAFPAEYIESELRKDHLIPNLNIERYVPLIQQVHEFEQKNPDYYSFVHANNKVVFGTYMLHKVLAKRFGIKQHPWELPLRLINDLCPDYVAEYIQKYGPNINNYDGDHQKYLLSANCSCPGNLYGPESSIRYFAANHAAQIPTSLITQYLKDVHPDVSYTIRNIIEAVLPLFATTLDAPEGFLLQLLIPKVDVDKYVYLARGGGNVLQEKIGLSDGTELLDGYDTSLKCYTKASPFLQLYTDENKVHLLKNCLERAQVRIIMHKDLYATCPIKTKVYTYASQASMAQYMQEMTMLADWIYSITKSYGRLFRRVTVPRFIIEKMEQLAKSTDNSARLVCAEVARKLVMQGLIRGRGIITDAMIEVIKLRIQDEDYHIRLEALYMLEDTSLIEQGLYLSDVVAVAAKMSKDPHYFCRYKAISLFRRLLKQQCGIAEAIRAACDGIRDIQEVQIEAGWLLYHLVYDGYGLKEAEDAIAPITYGHHSPIALAITMTVNAINIKKREIAERKQFKKFKEQQDLIARL